MATLKLEGAGGSDVFTDEIEVKTDDFILTVNGREYRISTNDKGELHFALINGVDCKIRNCGGMWGNSYPGVVIVQSHDNRVRPSELDRFEWEAEAQAYYAAMEEY